MSQINNPKTFANPPFSHRRFLFEVVGISKKEDNNFHYPIRKSGSTFIVVPYARMKQEIRRIHLLGGKIVNITPFLVIPPFFPHPQH